jgi:hypothetical protein
VTQIRKCSGTILGLLLSLLTVHVSVVSAETPLTTIDMPQGGRIVYGKVQGADTQGAAMTHVLRIMHQNCGEKPKIGNVFRMRRTDSVGLFFTVVNRPAGNVQVAGLIIAAGSGPHQAEAALVSDRADRFGSTINPMLKKLFSVWHPAMAMAAARSNRTAATTEQPVSAPASGTNGSSGKVPPMHRVTLPDRTASVSVPEGWNFVPQASKGGTIVLIGPHGQGEGIMLNAAYSGQDPTNPGYQRSLWQGYRPLPGTVLFPYNGDLVKAFPELYMRLARSIRWNPSGLQVDHAEMVDSGPGSRCVHATGRVNAFGNGMLELNEILCLQAPDPNTGLYGFSAFASQVPVAFADQDRATAAAILASFQWDRALVQQRTDAMMAPVLAKMKQDWDAQQAALIQANQRAVDNIRQIGANATARYNATQAANDAQHAAWRQGQEANSRNIQGFSNYLLDQTVIHDVQDPNTHVTVWNQAAEAWKRAYPDRIEEVPTSRYINGQDY